MMPSDGRGGVGAKPAIIVFDVPSATCVRVHPCGHLGSHETAAPAGPAAATAATAAIATATIPRRSDRVIRFEGAWALLAMTSPLPGVACVSIEKTPRGAGRWAGWAR